VSLRKLPGVVLGALLGLACGPAPAPSDASSPPPPPAPSAPKSPSAPEPRPEPPPSAPAETPVASPSCPEHAAPPDVPAPEAATASPGDGVWTRLGDATRGDRAGSGEPFLYQTRLHPHPASRFITVTVAAVDLCRARVGYAPGSEDAPKIEVLGRGLVPPERKDALVAVFNGGWKPEHGRWGMFKDGVSVVPAREGGCTVSVDKNGKVTLSSALPTAVESLEAYRQTPPCLFENSELHPRLAAGDEKPWGGRAKDVVTRRRSAVGVSGDGRFLFYAVGDEASPKWLAKALMHAGASTGAELDINWYWTRFLLFGEKDGALAVTSTLIPGMEYQSRGYVERPSGRDFFYVLRRDSPSP
jgi:hypothetical protein